MCVFIIIIILSGFSLLLLPIGGVMRVRAYTLSHAQIRAHTRFNWKNFYAIFKSVILIVAYDAKNFDFPMVIMMMVVVNYGAATVNSTFSV